MCMGRCPENAGEAMETFREVAPAIGICPAERPLREPGPALSEELVMAIAAGLVFGWQQLCES